MSPLRSDEYSLAASQTAQLPQNAAPSPSLNPSLASYVSATSAPMRAVSVDAAPVGTSLASPTASLAVAEPRRPWWAFWRRRTLKAKQVNELRYVSLVMARTLAFAGELAQPYDAAKAKACVRHTKQIALLGDRGHFDRCEMQDLLDAMREARLALIAIRDGYTPNGRRERRRLRKRMAGTDVPSLAEGVLKQVRRKEKWLTKLLRQTGSAVPKQIAPAPPRFA
jgi:hypothetical protein